MKLISILHSYSCKQFLYLVLWKKYYDWNHIFYRDVKIVRYVTPTTDFLLHLSSQDELLLKIM